MTTHLPQGFRFFVAVSLTTSVLLTLSGCHSVPSNTANQVASSNSPTLAPVMQAVVGDYADEGYADRAQGYDWVGVMVRAAGDKQIDIKIRARSDLKKPTCQFDGKAVLMGQDETHGIMFQINANNTQIFFQFKENTLTIDGQESGALSYFCSGGGSLAGTYQKLGAPLELAQPH